MWTAILSAASSILGIISKALGLAKTNQDEKAGVSMQVAADETAGVKAETAIAQAEASATHTDAGVDSRLKKGTF